MHYCHRRIAEKKLTKNYRQNDHDILPKMICLYQTRPDKGKSKLLLRPQTLVVSAPRSRIEYLDFGDFKILQSMDQDYHDQDHGKSENLISKIANA